MAESPANDQEPQPPHESELIELARAGDAGAWSEIYATYHSVIYRYARARVFDDGAAEDVTSDIFLAALKAVSSYRERGRPLLAWLYGIARHTVADHQRRSAPERRFVLRILPKFARRGDEEQLVASPGTPAPNPSDPGEQIDRLDLRRAIARLPEGQREVVILRHYAGLTTPEIATATGKKPAAVYSLEARALLGLREQLAGFREISRPTDEKRASGPISMETPGAGE